MFIQGGSEDAGLCRTFRPILFQHVHNLIATLQELFSFHFHPVSPLHPSVQVDPRKADALILPRLDAPQLLPRIQHHGAGHGGVAMPAAAPAKNISTSFKYFWAGVFIANSAPMRSQNAVGSFLSRW